MADYPISNVPRRVVYAPSGVGPYAFTFEILNQTDIAVYKANTLLTLTTDYTVTINANGTGSVTLTTTAGTSNITIIGARAIQRSSDYTTGGDLFASTLNVDLDSQTIFSQQVAETAQRSLKAAITDSTALNMDLPAAQTRANKLLGFTAGGEPVASNTTVNQLDAAVQSFVSGTGNNAATVVYTPAGTSAVATTVQTKLRETVSVKDFGAVGNGVTDDTVAIQAAVNACANKELFFPPGNYLITSQINILTRVSLTGAGKNQVTILLGTQNQDGFVVGDGTLATRGNCGNVSIENIDFNPKNGVTAFASGACIFLNYVFGTKIQHCTIYGKDSTANKLYNGIVVFQTLDYLLNYCNCTNLLGYGHYASGTSALLQTANSRVDFCQFIEIGLDCVYFGDHTEGMTINCLIAYQYTGAGIRIEATPNNRNIFILQPDLEVSGSAVGIYVDGGVNVNIVGGWIGGTANVGLYVENNSSGVYAIGVIFGQSTIILKGGACQIVGCDVAGNSVLASTGIEIWGTATGTVISGNSIRQWPTNGIEFTTGNAARTNISGNNFNLNGVDILGGNWSPATAAPANISSNTTDFAFAITAASSITLSPTKTFYQVTGVTAVSTINVMTASVQIVIQAGTGGITLNHGVGNLALKGGVNASVPAFSLITLMSEGTSWIELSRSF
jgi:hypothetical protein